MLDAARHDEELVLLDPFRAFAAVFAIVHAKAALHDQKHFVFIFVMMPGERAFEFDELDELPIQFTGNARIPVIVDQRKFIGKIDLLHGRLVLFRGGLPPAQITAQRKKAGSSPPLNAMIDD